MTDPRLAMPEDVIVTASPVGAEAPDRLELTAGPRDLAVYSERYSDLPFEAVQARYRRRRIVEQVRACSPRRVLEVGCGENPLFADLPGVEVITVEPADAFARSAMRAAASVPRATVIHDFIENVDAASAGGPVDVVVLASLLHEVPRPDVILRAVRQWCSPTTVLHVNVPQATSLHRRLGVAMQLLPTERSLTPQQLQMQQSTVYDRDALTRDLHAAGFVVRQEGGLLVKPFSHAQMQQLIDLGFLSEQMLDGLDAMASTWPEGASEIWVDAVLADD